MDWSALISTAIDSVPNRPTRARSAAITRRPRDHPLSLSLSPCLSRASRPQTRPLQDPSAQKTPSAESFDAAKSGAQLEVLRHALGAQPGRFGKSCGSLDLVWILLSTLFSQKIGAHTVNPDHGTRCCYEDCGPHFWLFGDV